VRLFHRHCGALRKAAFIAVASLAAPAIAQEPAPSSAQPGLTAATWCAIVSDSGSDPEESGRKPGCDVGMGAALYRWHRLAWVVVIGTETAGTGIALVTFRPPPGESGTVVAIAAGVVTPYDREGIYVDEWALALGATFGFGGGS